MMFFRSIMHVIAGQLVIGWVLLAFMAAPALAGGDVPLAVVNGDTISSADLEKEIVIMKKLKLEGQQGDVVLPSAEDVLKRMIQNQLILQEGYRLETQITLITWH